ncbi:MAG TPA: AI-2E family transporter [Hyphomicrobiaceae bacterium]|jgi:predicted PurR-regulated permease PerM
MCSDGPGRQTAASAAAGLTIALVLGVFLYVLRNILIPFVLAGIVAFLCSAPIDRLAARTRWPRRTVAVAVLLVLMAAAGAVGYYGGPAVMRDLIRIVGDLEGYVERLIRQLMGGGTISVLGQQLDAAQIAAYAVDQLKRWVAEGGRTFVLASSSFASLFGFILTWVLLGYMLIDGPAISRGLFWLVPPRQRPFASRVWDELEPILRRYFVGVGAVVLFASLAAYIGLSFLGIRHAPFLALATGLLEIVPLLGPAASAVLVGLFAIEQARSAWSIVEYALYATALRISIDQFFGPIVLGKAAYVRPVLVIFCFLAGGYLFGVIGVLLAVPAALVLKVVLGQHYREGISGRP